MRRGRRTWVSECGGLVVFEDSCADEKLGRHVEPVRGIIGKP